MTNTDAAYFAGIIDGEGSICLTRLCKGDKFRRPDVTFPSTSIEMLEFFQRQCGGQIVKKKIYKDHHSPSWTARLRHSSCLPFLEAVLPYLRHPEKIRRARMLVDEYPNLTARNGKYTPEQVAAKLAFEARFLGG